MPDPIQPRDDGLRTREQAAALCRDSPQAITNWTTAGYGRKGAKILLPVAKRERGRPLFDPLEVARAEFATAKRARRDSPALRPPVAA